MTRRNGFFFQGKDLRVSNFELFSHASHLAEVQADVRVDFDMFNAPRDYRCVLMAGDLDSIMLTLRHHVEFGAFDVLEEGATAYFLKNFEKGWTVYETISVQMESPENCAFVRRTSNPLRGVEFFVNSTFAEHKPFERLNPQEGKVGVSVMPDIRMLDDYIIGILKMYDYFRRK